MTGFFFLILFLACLRLFERALNRSIIPFDPRNQIDHRLHMDRRPRELPVPKDLTTREYDPVAREQLKRVHDRRRKPNIDTGLRRRRDDR
jgi:hypothetical protein